MDAAAAAAADAAAAAAAEADRTLVFNPVELKTVYERTSRYIAGVHPSTPGVIVRSTETHDVVAVHSDFISDRCEDLPETVQYYSDDTQAAVDAVAKLTADVTVLFAKRKGERFPDIQFSDLDPQDGVSEKVVTFFPYMDTVSMFKGHVGLRDAASRDMGLPEQDVQPSSINTFSFTAPFASVSFRKDDHEDNPELLETHAMTLGAPVFNLDGHIVGILSNVGKDYSLKFARNAAYLLEVLSRLPGEQVNWLKGKEKARASL